MSALKACMLALMIALPGAAGSDTAEQKFPDYGFLPDPAVYRPARVFKLSQNYPATPPAMDSAVRNLLTIDFKSDWRSYAAAAFDYVLEGNVHGRGVDNDFFLEDNKVRGWYHVPWLHVCYTGPGAPCDNGREGLHGLTAEGPEAQKSLGPLQITARPWQTYAVGFYNAPGGYGVGRTWANHQHPDPDALRRMGGFPVGTVVGKLLFSTAPISEVPYLGNALAWNAFIRPTECAFTVGKQTPANCLGPDGKLLPIVPREVDQVRLIQMDIMVRDTRADSTGGWVFLTYVYNGAVANPNLWRNLVPLGAMWGDDPRVHTREKGNPTPTRLIVNADLKQTVINAGDPNLPPPHLGFGLRLAGPADNTLSSCKSCHSTAEYPQISPILGFLATDKAGKALTPASPQWRLWFRNLGPTTPFDPQSTPTDNSLQLSESIQNFMDTRQVSSLTATTRSRKVFRIAGERGATPSTPTHRGAPIG